MYATRRAEARPPARALRPEEGSILVQALVFIVLISLMSNLLVNVMLGRFLTVHKANTDTSLALLTQAVESQVGACLQGTDFGKSSCSIGDYADCLPGAVGGRKVTVRSAWSAGSPRECAVSIKVSD